MKVMKVVKIVQKSFMSSSAFLHVLHLLHCLHFSFTNADPVFHDWEVEGVANIDAGARPGQTQRIRFLAPAPGTYRVVCTVAGHAEAGMTGTLVVE